MLEKFKANILFEKLLGRPDIEKAYAMVPPTDSWYDTITKVHNSLKEIQEKPHDILEMTSHDNLKLKGVYYPNNNSKNVTVICVHGYTSHAEREWAFPGLFYLSLGYNVLIPYQRAHGLSMGGGIALNLADKDMKNVKGIISDAPSVSIREFFENVSKEVFKKGYEKVAEHAIARFKKEFGADVKEFECVDIVKKSKYPILLSAGSMEKMEEVLDELKKANPKTTDVIILPGCSHGNGMYKQTKMYQAVIKDFIQEAILLG